MEKPEDEGGRIPTLLYFSDEGVLFGHIMKGRDVEGDLHKFVPNWEVPYRRMELSSRKTISKSFKNLKEIKFTRKFNKLTIIGPNSTLLFRRFVRERPHHQTSDLL